MAAIRDSNYCREGKAAEAVDLLEQMISLGQPKPPVSLYSKLLLHLADIEAWELKARFLSLCDQPSRKKESPSVEWNNRKKRIDDFLNRAYGRPAGKGQVRGVYANVANEIRVFDSDTRKNEVLFEEIDKEYATFCSLKERIGKSAAKTKSSKRKIMNLHLAKKRGYSKQR